MGFIWNEDLVNKRFIDIFRQVVVDEDRDEIQELKEGDVFYHCGKLNFEGVEKGSLFDRKGKVKEFKSLIRGGRFVFVRNNYGSDKSSKILELFKKMWSKEEENIRRLIDDVGSKLKRGRLYGFGEDKEIDEEHSRWEKERLFYIDCLFNVWDRQYFGDKRYKWLDSWRESGKKIFEYKVHNWYVDNRVRVLSEKELIRIFSDLRVYHWKSEYKKYEEENSYWFVGSDWKSRTDGRSIRTGNWIKKNNNSVWRKWRKEKKEREEEERKFNEKYDNLGYYKQYIYLHHEVDWKREETYLEGVRRRKREVESEIPIMKKRFKENMKENLNFLVKEYTRYKNDEMTDDELDRFINHKDKMFRDGNILWNEMIRFKRLKEIKGILTKWTKNIDKEGLGMILGIRVRLKKKGMMTSGQWKWFIYKLGGESNLDNIKLKEMWKLLDEGNTSHHYGVNDTKRILSLYGIEWDKTEGLDTRNLKRDSFEKYMKDQDYRERIGKEKVRGKLEDF